MSKKNKFDLTNLVNHGYLKDKEELFFVSDPSKKVQVHRLPNHEFKLKFNEKVGKEATEEVLTVHQTAQKFLGTEPPDHACRWLRNAKGKTLYELWQMDLEHDGEYAQAA